MFDPEVPELTALLPESSFPDTRFRRPDILAALHPLGLRDTLGRSGLVTAAKSVQALRDAGSIEGALETGRALLTYIDNLVRPLDDKVESRWSQGRFKLVETDSTAKQRSREILAALQELRVLSWVRHTYIFAVGGFVTKKGFRLCSVVTRLRDALATARSEGV